MSELRWALLIIGLLILAGIYFYHQWRAHSEVKNIFRSNEPVDKDILLDEETGVDHELDSGVSTPSYSHSSTTEIDPVVEERPEPDLFSTIEKEPNLDSELTIGTAAEHKTDSVPQQPMLSGLPEKLEMVVMHIVAEKENPFAGEAIVKALQAHKLRFGEHNIFHRILEENGKKLTVYSVASMTKPGTLDPEEIKKMKLPGMTLILNLPAPVESLKAYDDMLHAAQHMASTLGGTLMDEEFMTLSREKIALDRAKLF